MIKHRQLSGLAEITTLRTHSHSSVIFSFAEFFLFLFGKFCILSYLIQENLPTSATKQQVCLTLNVILCNFLI